MTELESLAAELRLNGSKSSDALIHRASDILMELSKVDVSLVGKIKVRESQNDSWWAGSIEPNCKTFDHNLVCGDGKAIQLCSLRERKKDTAARKKFWKNLIGAYNAVSKANRIAAGQ